MTFVNTLVTVVARVPEHDERREAGRRLKAALDRLYPRSRGGLRRLADDAKIGPETLYRWFRGDSEPDLGTLRRLAQACGVSRTALVAAMDGEEISTPDPEQEPVWVQAAVDRAVGSVRGALLDPDLTKEELLKVVRLLARVYTAALEQGLLPPPPGAGAHGSDGPVGGRGERAT